MKTGKFPCICFIALLLLGGIVAVAAAVSNRNTGEVAYGEIDQSLAAVAYMGDERFIYDVSWSGGIKIGEIHLNVARIDDCENCFEIRSVITTSGGIAHKLYPIEDRHITYVKGEQRLPYFCEIWQKQGRNYRAHKTIIFDQKNHRLTKQKDGEQEQVFTLSGVVHNEFSSFFSSRVMDLRVGGKLLVPTFGDDSRNEVIVETLEKTVVKETLFGPVETLKVTPILTFSGLYDKRGDTIVWYTNDECRVPVRIESKIVLGSLTASLAEFSNPHCAKYSKKKVTQRQQ